MKFSDDKAVEIVNRLFDRTKTKQVNWRIDPDLGSDVNPAFYVSLPLGNEHDALVKRLIVELFMPEWVVFKALYDEAARFSLESDFVLQDLESALESHGTIGRPG